MTEPHLQPAHDFDARGVEFSDFCIQVGFLLRIVLATSGILETSASIPTLKKEKCRFVCGTYNIQQSYDG